jgi:hypothetical protein
MVYLDVWSLMFHFLKYRIFELQLIPPSFLDIILGTCFLVPKQYFPSEPYSKLLGIGIRID